MSLWDPRKPLNQPPQFRSMTVAAKIVPDEIAAKANSVHQASQFERQEKTLRYGMRAVISGRG